MKIEFDCNELFHFCKESWDFQYIKMQQATSAHARAAGNAADAIAERVKIASLPY